MKQSSVLLKYSLILSALVVLMIALLNTVGLKFTEKKLVEAYRAADKDTRDAALKLLKGEKADNDLLGSILGLLSGKK